ncbi:allophanate hydrolase subunit 1 [Sinorhizobium fredii GR64]|nr:allophanate hydrolase subunit 1 [Sinorhizobium fredii]WOS62018.1 allophanate hydrolase subunit 1 [Sinorhizobium fredii GR64]
MSTGIHSASANGFPRFRPLADRALLVEFGEEIDRRIHDQVLQLDAALKAAPVEGFIEAVPAYASLLVCFDPVVTDHASIEANVAELVARGVAVAKTDAIREVEVCYDSDLSPDLQAVAEASGLTADQVIEAHLSGDYSVFMYGFAPGYAYLAGVPQKIQRPRKQTAVRGVPAGSVVIAGPQCLVTTLTMPTGWWIIGRSPTKILNSEATERPFLFDVGDRVRFRRISRPQFDAGGSYE